MRFFTCYSLTTKRGFFVYQTFYFYDKPVGALLEHCPFMAKRFLYKYLGSYLAWHISYLPLHATFSDIAPPHPRILGLFLLRFFTPHAEPQDRYDATILRLSKMRSLRGHRMLKRYPNRGQRTRSNSTPSCQTRKYNQKLIIVARRKKQ
jgi:hypothetical protein